MISFIPPPDERISSHPPPASVASAAHPPPYNLLTAAHPRPPHRHHLHHDHPHWKPHPVDPAHRAQPRDYPHHPPPMHPAAHPAPYPSTDAVPHPHPAHTPYPATTPTAAVPPTTMHPQPSAAYIPAQPVPGQRTDKAHLYHHPVAVNSQPMQNVAPPPPPGAAPPPRAPSSHHPYVYPMHTQLVAPVAHVPIGAAHYAHLPPSIWNPHQSQYHHQPHPTLTAPPGPPQHRPPHMSHMHPTHATHMTYPPPPPPAAQAAQHQPPGLGAPENGAVQPSAAMQHMHAPQAATQQHAPTHAHAHTLPPQTGGQAPPPPEQSHVHPSVQAPQMAYTYAHLHSSHMKQAASHPQLSSVPLHYTMPTAPHVSAPALAEGGGAQPTNGPISRGCKYNSAPGANSDGATAHVPSAGPSHRPTAAVAPTGQLTSQHATIQQPAQSSKQRETNSLPALPLPPGVERPGDKAARSGQLTHLHVTVLDRTPPPRAVCSQKKPHKSRLRTEGEAACDGTTSGDGEKQTQGASGQKGTQQTLRKPRKPYTITKSREVWTPEEHERFRNALKLYDRDWKKIETYIGTKTVLQIRSHAQKHFGKVAKYKTGEYIPPPRPKKRAALPYPRSRASSQGKNGNGTGSDSGGNSDAGNAVSRGNMSNGTSGNASGSGSGNGSASGSGNEAVPVSPNRHITHVVANDTASRAHHVTARRPWLESSAEEEKDSKPGSSASTPVRLGTATAVKKSGIPGAQRYPTFSRNIIDEPKKDDEEDDEPASTTHPAPLVNRNAAHAEGHLPDETREKSQQNGLVANGTASSPPKTEKKEDEARAASPRLKRQHEVREDGMRSPKRMAVERNERARSSGDRQQMAVCGPQKVLQSLPRLNEEIAGLGPNDSLVVLSNCAVNSDSRDKQAGNKAPSPGWATAAAARRAHRLRTSQARKPPLPNVRTNGGGEYAGRDEAEDEGRDRSSARGEEASNAMARGTEGREGDEGVRSGRNEGEGDGHGDSSPAGNHGEREGGAAEAGEQGPAGCGNSSENNGSGGSGSDPATGSSGASGSGGSAPNSDAGDVEEDPKSSNDGSGDDNNGQSPSTRDSSPGDPNSSVSRENTPHTTGGADGCKAGDEKGVKEKRPPLAS